MAEPPRGHCDLFEHQLRVGLRLARVGLEAGLPKGLAPPRPIDAAPMVGGKARLGLEQLAAGRAADLGR